MKTDYLNIPFVSLSRRYGLLAIIWSVLAGASVLWDLHQENGSILEMASVATRANIQKDISFRKWVASHGGVYVSPTEHTPPNPYLNVPDRDVTTTTGKVLTLMNPAYVLREMQTDFGGDYGIKSHITSLKPLNPANAPDEWETRALESFERGGKEFLEFQEIGGQPYMRMMEPFIVDEGCLRCHASQGYKVGDVRGGIGSSVPLNRFYAHRKEHVGIILVSHGAIWLAVLAAMGIAYRNDCRLSIEKQRSQEKMQQQFDELLRFQKLTVGRELRMKELVEENAALRNRPATDQPGKPLP